jgi:hypothetical protein
MTWQERLLAATLSELEMGSWKKDDVGKLLFKKADSSVVWLWLRLLRGCMSATVSASPFLQYPPSLFRVELGKEMFIRSTKEIFIAHAVHDRWLSLRELHCRS